MASVELNLQLDEDQVSEPTSPAMLLAYAEAMQNGVLNENQREALGALRAGLVQLAALNAQSN
jgi:hypothetical protein